MASGSLAARLPVIYGTPLEMKPYPGAGSREQIDGICDHCLFSRASPQTYRFDIEIVFRHPLFPCRSRLAANAKVRSEACRLIWSAARTLRFRLCERERQACQEHNASSASARIDGVVSSAQLIMEYLIVKVGQRRLTTRLMREASFDLNDLPHVFIGSAFGDGHLPPSFLIYLKTQFKRLPCHLRAS